MARLKRRALTAEATRRNQEQLAALGAQVRTARRRRRLSQQVLADAAGVGPNTVSRLERGVGRGLTLDSLQRIALAAGRPLRIELQRDELEEVADAGHIAIQQLVLRLGRAAGYTARFEVPTRPADPARSADVGLRDDRGRRLVIVECWNTITDIGAAARSFNRKLADTEQTAVAIGGEKPYAVGGCWVVRATRRNRALVDRYPEVFASQLPGSSAAWVRALEEGGPVPAEPGFIWCDVGATRLYAWRRRGS